MGPTRVLDSRESDPLAGKSSRTVDVTGVAGVPASGVTAIVANVTVTTISGYGYLTVHPSGIARPIASNINYAPGDTAVPNLVSVAVGADGNIVVFNGGQTPVDFIIDIAGWYGRAQVTETGQDLSTFNPVGPTRVLDSRESDPLAGKSSRTVDVTGVAGVPASGVTAIVANVTVTTISGYGYLTVHPSGIARPIASNINLCAWRYSGS